MLDNLTGKGLGVNDSLHRESDLPLYLQLAEILRQRILSGEIESQLPTEPELCRSYGVARGTVRQALSKLETEGYVRRQRGRGTFVTWDEGTSLSAHAHEKQIGFIVPYVRDSFVSTMLLGVERATAERGWSVTFKHADNNPEHQGAVLSELVERRFAGVVIYPVDSEDLGPVPRLIRSGYPIVLVDRYLRRVPSDYVMSDHFGGSLQATQHLIHLGHERIGFVSWRDAAISMEHRAAGYRQALAEAGLAYQPELTVQVESYPAINLGPLYDLLQQQPRVTAIFAANDQIALAIYKTARELRIRIPEDLALVGFDDLEVVAHLDVPLTTVAQPTFEIGRTAVEVLMRRISGETDCWQRVILPTRLVVRRSCGSHLASRRGA